MKKIIYVLLALAVVSLYSCKKEPIDDSTNTTTTPGGTNTPGGGQGGGNQGGNEPGGNEPGGNEPGGNQPSAADFVGLWNMELYGNSVAHVTVTVNPILSGVLSMIGQEVPFSDMDEDVSFAGTPMTLSIVQGSGTQMTVSGTITLDLNERMGIAVDPMDFSFNTTAVYTETGLMIQNATISESVTFMTTGTMALEGTISFGQRTGFPTDGVLEVTLASLEINGTGSLTVPVIGQEIPNAATVAVNGTQMTAHGTK